MSTELARIPEPGALAGAGAGFLTFGEMVRRAKHLAASDLVPKALQGKPDSIVLIGSMGAELGVPFIVSLQDIHVIDNKPSPSAQLRLALIRRAGHEARFVVSSDKRAVIRGRRKENAHDPDAWVEVEWTIDQAEQAGLLDEWYEHWSKGDDGRRHKQVWREGDGWGNDSNGRPPWAIRSNLKRRENWHKYPAEMLRARAASSLCRMEFSDVLAALGVDDRTPEEQGIHVDHDLDDPNVIDGEVVEDDEPVESTTVRRPPPRRQQEEAGAATLPAPAPPANPEDIERLVDRMNAIRDDVERARAKQLFVQCFGPPDQLAAEHAAEASEFVAQYEEAEVPL